MTTTIVPGALLVAQFAVMFGMAFFAQLVMVPAHWFHG